MATKTAKGKPAPAAEVIDPEAMQLTTLFGDQEGTLAAKALEAVRSFVGGLQGFVSRARDLELRAAQTLEQASRLKPPANSTEDEAIQSFIRTANSERKEVEEHWTVTSAIHQFHRRMTAQRDKPVKALERAAAIGQQLHNTYVEAERRRAQEEEDRIRRQKEEEARQQRERELAQAEEEAIRREAAMPTLSEREQIFVDLVVAGVVASQAAHRAGFKDTTRGVRMLEMPKIAAAIKAKQDAAAIRKQAEAKRQQPLAVEHTEVKPDITRASGAVDRTTHSAELLNEAALISACIAGGHGIPHDILRVDPAKLNEYARSLQERINLWPGVRYKRNTKTV